MSCNHKTIRSDYMANNFNVLDMAQEYADANDTEASDIFKKHPVSGNVKNESNNVVPESDTESERKPKRRTWSPDASVLEDLPEMKNNPVTYAKDEIHVEKHDGLKNIADDNALEDSINAMDELGRTHANIEKCKERRGITKLQIPEGEWQVRITAAAADTDYKRAQKNLDEIFDEIEANFPDFILERVSDNSTNGTVEVAEENPTEEANTMDVNDSDVERAEPVEPESNNSSVQVVINKQDAPSVAWTDDEAAKIRKAKTIELNIVEARDIEFSSIDEVPGNAIDAVLKPYQRRANDVEGALPASKYRATFRGLSYVEVIDMQLAMEMNSLDSSLKQWTICFNHMSNPSIGDWEEYRWYIDPATNKRVKLNMVEPIPDGIDPNAIHEVSKFQDFLMKTSTFDLQFMLWKILCATSKGTETLSITCNHVNDRGVKCPAVYDWVYSPANLLDPNDMDPAVLNDMKKTSEADTSEEIINNYNTSPVKSNNVVTLPSSGMKICFGHCSAYEYINSVQGVIAEYEERYKQSKGKDGSLSETEYITYQMLSVITGVLIPNGNGGYSRIRSSEGIVKTINTLDAEDYSVLVEVFRFMTEPYTLKFVLKDAVCPKCNHHANIDIPSVYSLLFYLARSMENTSVILKRL